MGATAYNIKYKIATAIKYSLEIVSIVLLLYLVTTASIAYCADTMDLKAVENILKSLNAFVNYLTPEEKAFFIKNLNATVTDSQIIEHFKFNNQIDVFNIKLNIIKQKFELFKLVDTQIMPVITTYKSYLIDGTPIPPDLDTQLRDLLKYYNKLISILHFTTRKSVQMGF